MGIAGIVSLIPEKPILKNHVNMMLRAMKPRIKSEMLIHELPECSAVIGEIVYSPDSIPDSVSYNTANINVCLAGEFYNNEVVSFQNNKEFIADLYLSQKENFSKELNGSFAVVIADRKNGIIFIVTDHTCSYPFFTTVHDDKLYFATEVKALLAIDQINNQPDETAVISLITNGFLSSRHTLVKNIKQMDYATVCRIADGNISSYNYWRYRIQPKAGKSKRKHVKEFSAVINEAVERIIRVGNSAILLSGGIDSRGILCCVSKPQKLKAVTYTLRSKYNKHEFGDLAIAEKIASKINMEHHVVHADKRCFLEAMRESVFFSDGASGFIFENIWDRVANINGCEYLLIGDECMGWVNGLTSRRQILSTLGIHCLSEFGKLKSCLNPGSLGRFIEINNSANRKIVENYHDVSVYDAIDELYMKERLIHYLNPKRRVINHYGLGVRKPWLDRNVMSYMSSVPASLRISKKLFRLCLMHLKRELMNFPRARENETVTYKEQIVTLGNKAVSNFIFHDNPWIGDYFNESAVKDLTKNICQQNTAISQGSDKQPWEFLPVSMRLKIGAVKRYISKPIPSLDDEKLLLRIMTVAESLRQLHWRFRTLP